MKDKIKNAKNSVVAHVSDYRVSYAFIAGIVLATYSLNKIDRVAEWNKFLAAEGLTEKFYNPEEYLESLSPSLN